MSDRTIEVPDPDPAEPQVPPPGSPYKNLLVPLVVVPFMVVGVLVLVFVSFGAISGEETSIEENLARVVDGGLNERKQAAMSLVSQALENGKARAEGKPEPWPVGPDFIGRLARAWEEVSKDAEPSHRGLAIAQLSALYGDPAAFERLSVFLDATPDQDKDGQLRISALMAISWLQDERAAARVIPFLKHEESFLRQAAAVLQNQPSEASKAALAGLLDDPSLELRGQAAISLSHLGDARGAAVLRELVDPQSYAAVRAQNPAKFVSDRLVETTRLHAVAGLARLGRPEDRPLLEEVAKSDSSPQVREAAMRALQSP
ncbi:MAG: HEAT repeat domain-containing protein [Planctomycetota bacterium]|nr:HEAT repeat domain-containing protein [Planctomycetota bacterium]